jgi:hypothetical protein
MKDPPTEVGGFARDSLFSVFHFLLKRISKWQIENKK